jgi:hypothetical protein
MDLLQEVTVGLGTRKGEWQRIADDLAPHVSYSMIEKLGRDRYESSPTIGKLEKIAWWLRTHPQAETAT